MTILKTSIGSRKNSRNILEIDTKRMYAAHVGEHGLTEADVNSIADDLSRAHESIARNTVGGVDAKYAALNLGDVMPSQLGRITNMAAQLGAFPDIVLVGIGGSSLGAKAVWQALRTSLSAAPRLHFVENVDPFDLRLLLSQLDAAKTAIVCISKSGGTIETVAQYLVLRAWLDQALGAAEAKRHQWIVTDPVQGWLRKQADEHQLPSLPVPPMIGGRYSVLSAVGLLPLAAIGVDIAALLQGAAANAAQCRSADIRENRALEMAALCFLLDVRKHKRVSILMPYVNRLQLFGDWYRQLWAESLGKLRADQDPAGTLPVPALGTVDQHSQLQMYLESRHDKMFTFLELGTEENDVSITLTEAEGRTFPFLSGKSLGDVLSAEFHATRQTITESGHPNMTISLPVLDAFTLGQLIDLYQRTTIYAGELYGIDPLDQPAVEKSKKLTVQFLSQD